MENAIQTALATIAALLLVFVDVRGEVAQQEDSSAVDAFKIFRTFPSVVAIYDVDHDGDLDCVIGVRTEFSQEPEEATYVLQLKSLGGRPPFNLTYHGKRGPAPNTPYFTVGDDYDFVQQAHFDYTDYQNCATMPYPYKDMQECVLWTTKDSLNDVPERCMQAYRNFCQDAALPYDEGSCADFIL